MAVGLIHLRKSALRRAHDQLALRQSAMPYSRKPRFWSRWPTSASHQTHAATTSGRGDSTWEVLAL